MGRSLPGWPMNILHRNAVGSSHLLRVAGGPSCLHSPFSHLQSAAGEPRASVPTSSAPPAVSHAGGPPCFHSPPLTQDRRLPPPGRRRAPAVHAVGAPLFVEVLHSGGSSAPPEAREPTAGRCQSYLYGNFANRPSISIKIHCKSSKFLIQTFRCLLLPRRPDKWAQTVKKGFKP
jgi:hypothetical protein